MPVFYHFVNYFSSSFLFVFGFFVNTVHLRFVAIKTQNWRTSQEKMNKNKKEKEREVEKRRENEMEGNQLRDK